MTDLVVTIPRQRWPQWLAEGDCAGDDRQSKWEWGFALGRGGVQPPIEPGERLYILAHGHIRGYAHVTRVAFVKGAWAIYRRQDSHAVTIAGTLSGFPGWRRRWWERKDEIAFPDWKTEGVFYADGVPTETHRALPLKDARP